MKDIVTRLRNHIAITTTFSDDGFGNLVYQKGPSPICQEAADTIEELTSHIEDLVTKCEQLQNERDEARREVCGFHHLTGYLCGEYAKYRGWDCFKDDKRVTFPQSVTDFQEFLKGQDKIFLDMNDRIIKERDEARRMVCRALYTDKIMQIRHAQLCGWNCFNNDYMDKIAKLDEEMGLND